MKKILTLILFTIFTTLCYSQNASSVTIFDSRNVNDSANFLKRAVRFDFKYRTTINVPGTETYSTNMTIAPWGDASGGSVHQLNFNKGGLYYRQGDMRTPKWFAWQKLMLMDPSNKFTGNFSIDGLFRAKEIKVEATGWADYVFDPNYRLPSLQSVEKHIKEKKHLPDIPSEKQIMEEGVNVAEMQAKLLQKIEELMLYTIEQDKRINELENQTRQLMK